MYNADEVAKKLQEDGYEINKRTVNYYAFEKKLFEVEGGKNCFTDKEVKKIKYIKDLQQYTNYTLQQIKDIINRYTDEEIMDIIGDKLSKAHTHYGYGTKDNIGMSLGSYNGYSDSLSASSNLSSYQNCDSNLLGSNISHLTSNPYTNNMNYAIETNSFSKPDNDTLFGSSVQGVSKEDSKSLSCGTSSSEGCSTSRSCSVSNGISSGSHSHEVNNSNSISGVPYFGGGYSTTPQLVERTSTKIPINNYITLKVYNYLTNEKVVDEIVEFMNFKINEPNCGGYSQSSSGYSGKYRKFNYKEYSISFEFVLEVKEDDNVNKSMLDEIINFIKFKTKK